jgi:hypothetical protein
MVSVTVVSKFGIVVTPSYPMVLVPTTVVAVESAATTDTGSSTGKKPEIVIFWLTASAE